MPHDKIDDILASEIRQLEQTGRQKGHESVIRGVIPARNGRGPRFLLEGYGDQPFLRMNSNNYLGMSFRDEAIALAPLTSKADWDHWFEIMLVGHFSAADIPAC